MSGLPGLVPQLVFGKVGAESFPVRHPRFGVPKHGHLVMGDHESLRFPEGERNAVRQPAFTGHLSFVTGHYDRVHQAVSL